MKKREHGCSGSFSAVLVTSPSRMLINTMTTTAIVASSLLPLLLMPVTTATAAAASGTCASSPTPSSSCRAPAAAARHTRHTTTTSYAFIASKSRLTFSLGRRWQSQQHGSRGCTRAGSTPPWKQRHQHLARRNGGCSSRGMMFAAAATAAGTEGEEESGGGVGVKGGVTGVYDESWYLGDGGFAGRHLQDEDRIDAKEVKLVKCACFWFDFYKRRDCTERGRVALAGTAAPSLCSRTVCAVQHASGWAFDSSIALRPFVRHLPRFASFPSRPQ